MPWDHLPSADSACFTVAYHPREGNAISTSRVREASGTGTLMCKFPKSWASSPTPAQDFPVVVELHLRKLALFHPALCPASHFPPWGLTTAAHPPVHCFRQGWHWDRANNCPAEGDHVQSCLCLLHTHTILPTVVLQHGDTPVDLSENQHWSGRTDSCALQPCRALPVLGID